MPPNYAGYPMPAFIPPPAGAVPPSYEETMRQRAYIQAKITNTPMQAPFRTSLPKGPMMPLQPLHPLPGLQPHVAPNQ